MFAGTIFQDTRKPLTSQKYGAPGLQRVPDGCTSCGVYGMRLHQARAVFWMAISTNSPSGLTAGHPVRVASCFTAWSSKRQPLTRFSQSKSVAEPWTPKPQYMGVTSVKWVPQLNYSQSQN